MKKFKFLGLCLFCLMLVGCGKSGGTKEVGSIDNFNTIALNNGFNVINNMDSYLDIDYISDAALASIDDMNIEMIIYTDTESAIKVQDEQITNFKSIKATAATEHKDKGDNYYKFWMISNGYYMVNCRVDNTLIFSKTLLQNKEKVEKLLADMGY